MLTQSALKKINNVHTRIRIALALGIAEQTVIRYIRDNDENLTKAKAMEVIRNTTGLIDTEILEDSKIPA